MIIDNLQLGAPSDSLYVQLRGHIEFSLARRLRINSYDLQTQIDANRNFRLELLDLMLSNTKTETLKGYRYKARIQGDKDSSNIEKLSVF